jgi:hypothetical protein
VKKMLETRQERVKLLKSGFTGKKIEELYIRSNGFKITRSTVLFDPLKNSIKENNIQSMDEKNMKFTGHAVHLSNISEKL